MSNSPYIYWLSELRKSDSQKVGPKAAMLGELTTIDVAVPNGFVLSSQAYFDFLAQTSLQDKLQTLLREIDIHDSESLYKISRAAQELIVSAKTSSELKEQVKQAYLRLSSKDVFVAVRPSVSNVEPTSSLFDGNHLSQLNVFGVDHLCRSIVNQWTIAYQPRTLFYLYEHGVEPTRLPVSVIVQRMIEAEVSGVLFTSDLLHPKQNITAVEAVWGLGEPLIEGQLVPDHYHVDTTSWKITSKDVSRQEWQLMRTARAKKTENAENNKRLPVSVSWQKKQKLSDAAIVKLAKMGAKIVRHFEHEQDVEWVYAHNSLFIVQTRPSIQIPTDASDEALHTVSALSSPGMQLNLPPLLSGEGVSPGNVCGSAYAVKPGKKIPPPPDSVIFIEEFDEESLNDLTNVLAIVSDRKSTTSPLLASAKEKGIPVVVGVVAGMRMVKSGETVTVDGTHGLVYEGHVHVQLQRPSIKTAHAKVSHVASPILGHLQTTMPTPQPSSISTATKLYVNLTEPDTASELAQKDVDGVGLLRAEYMIKYLGEHPQHLLKKGKEQAYVDALYEGIKLAAKEFSPRPVTYRLSDFTANQYAALAGGEDVEVREDNPSIGFRGAYRYIAEPEVLQLELQAIKRARQYFKNIWIMVPFVRTPQELVEVKRLISEAGLHRSGSLKLFMMVEVPSNVLLLDQFIGVGVDGVTIGSNDLTQLILGLDRRNPRVAAGFDERHDAVMVAIEQVVRGAAKHGILSSICGQAPSAYPDLTRKLVEWGISSISVSPEAASATRRMIADAEFELVRQGKIIKYGR